MKTLPQKYSIYDNVKVLADFEVVLEKHGIVIPQGSSLEKAGLYLKQIIKSFEDKAAHDFKIDCRENWRRALSLADLTRKIIAVSNHPDFRVLVPHIRLLLKPSSLSQFSFSPKEDGTNNKVFELFVGAMMFRILEQLEFDDPERSSFGENPDLIGTWNGKKLGVACKVAHASSPKAFPRLIRSAIKQVEKSNVDRGIVIVNLKNLIPHDEIWPARYNETDGKWEYAAYENRDAPVTLLRQSFRHFEEKIFEAVGGASKFIHLFANTKVVPMVLIVCPVVAGVSYGAGLHGPVLVKQMFGMGVARELLQKEDEAIIDLTNYGLHNRIT